MVVFCCFLLLVVGEWLSDAFLWLVDQVLFADFLWLNWLVSNTF